jgi:hypothetical protein
MVVKEFDPAATDTAPAFVPPKEAVISPEFTEFLDTIDRLDLVDKVNSRHPIVLITMECGRKGLPMAGGLGALYATEAEVWIKKINAPVILLSPLYADRMVQTITRDKDGFHQRMDTVPVPPPETFGILKSDVAHIELDGGLGPHNGIPVYLYPDHNEYGQHYLLKTPGRAYPSHNSSDERIWNNVIMGFGSYQLIKQLQEKKQIDEPSAVILNESATIFYALAMLDDLTEQYMITLKDPEKAYAAALAKVQTDTVFFNHTLEPAADGKFNFDTKDDEQVRRFIFSNLKSKIVQDKLTQFINDQLQTVEGGGERLPVINLSLFLSGKWVCVSKLHAETAQTEFRKNFNSPVFYGRPIEFDHGTNAIEEDWNLEIAELLLHYGVTDKFGYGTRDLWERMRNIPPEAILDIKQRGVERFCHQLATGERKDPFGETVSFKDQYGNIIDLPLTVLMILEGRRFALYKQRDMFISKPELLEFFLRAHPDYHHVISGKAAPGDTGAENVLAHVLNVIDSRKIFRERVHFIDNWDTEVAYYAVQAARGAMNTPWRPKEACGTSGMKLIYNGALFGSTVDGFLDELPQDAFYPIRGATYEEQCWNYYVVLDRILKDAEDPDAYVANVIRQWANGGLEIVNGPRMAEDYLNIAFPRSS